jgi:hypothetical protein
VRQIAVYSVTKTVEMGQVKINLFVASSRISHETGLDLAQKPPICHRMDSHVRQTLKSDRKQ